jgi:hypothetical protein
MWQVGGATGRRCADGNRNSNAATHLSLLRHLAHPLPSRPTAAELELRSHRARHQACALRACLRDAPEQPLTANDRHLQQPANMKLALALNPRATHRGTLVMRRSLYGDEDQGADVPIDFVNLALVHSSCEHTRRCRGPVLACLAGSAEVRGPAGDRGERVGGQQVGL